jgi:two-component system chemotaxis response regulator CheB
VRRRDIVVIGASAGGVTTVKELVRRLPTRLDAAVMIVVHVPPSRNSVLPQILARVCPLHVAHAEDGDLIEACRVYVAPPDQHLLIQDGRLRLFRGPRENHNRPAIDMLFRSAAHVYGDRVIGVILSGSLDDGSDGLRLIKQAGGIAIVQDPDQAEFGEMPENAMLATSVDYRVRVEEIASLLNNLTSAEIPAMVEQEHPLDARDQPDHLIMPQQTAGDAAVAFSCPDCGGVLREVSDQEPLRYQCRVGHGYTADSLLASQSETVEQALWTAVRAMDEGADVASRLARRAGRRSRIAWVSKYEARASELKASARVIRQLLEGDVPADVPQ